MVKYFFGSIFGGLLFGVMDGVINANPFARKLFEVYKPITKTSINVPVGFAVDLFYGFVMAGVFLVLYPSLPGSTGLAKGLSYGVLMWFFRVVMSVISNWMMFKIPPQTLCYTFITGLVEMLVLGLFYGLFFRS